MNKIKIMEAAVEKWNRIIAGKKSDGGIHDCPPCRIFYWTICFGCPISEYTGKKFCKRTPYVDWYWHHIEEHGHIRKRIYCPECLRIATAMRDFMIEIASHLKQKSEFNNPPDPPEALPEESRPDPEDAKREDPGKGGASGP